jgi:hypothetical protein
MPKEKRKILYETGTPYLDNSRIHLNIGRWGVSAGEIEDPIKIVPKPPKSNENHEYVTPLEKARQISKITNGIVRKRRIFIVGQLSLLNNIYPPIMFLK